SGGEAGRAGCIGAERFPSGDLDADQLAADEELVPVLDEAGSGDAEEGAVGAAHVLHRESLAAGVQDCGAAGGEGVPREGDVADFAPEQVLALAQAERRAAHPALEQLDDAEPEPWIRGAPGDAAALARSHGRDALEKQSLAPEPELAAHRKLALGLQASE